MFYFSAALMKNTGTVFANDANKDRAKAVVGNIHRMGITNTVVSHYDGHIYPTVSNSMNSLMMNKLVSVVQSCRNLFPVCQTIGLADVDIVSDLSNICRTYIFFTTSN